MAKKPATPISKTTEDSLESLIKAYFEIKDHLSRRILSHPYDQKIVEIERKLRAKVGLPPPLANRSGT